MSPRLLALAAAALLFLPGCRSEAPEPDSETPENAVVDAADFYGTYRVRGRTVERQTGAGRDIKGTVVISGDGDGYKASFKLTTLFPTPDGPSEAQVVGTGSGIVEEGELRGTADTQIILAQVPGVNADFAFLPRHYGPRITSRSTSRINEDGSLTTEIENEAAAGQSYRGTRTTLRGMRISTDLVTP
jgi:hypothetical protein